MQHTEPELVATCPYGIGVIPIHLVVGFQIFLPVFSIDDGCDQGGTAFVAPDEDFEEQLGSGFRKWHEAQLIDDRQFVAGQLFLETEQLLLVSGIDQFTDQGGGRSEGLAMDMLTGSQAEGHRDVRFPGAAVAQQQRIFPAGEKLRLRQLNASNHPVQESEARKHIQIISALKSTSEPESTTIPAPYLRAMIAPIKSPLVSTS